MNTNTHFYNHQQSHLYPPITSVNESAQENNQHSLLHSSTTKDNDPAQALIDSHHTYNHKHPHLHPPNTCDFESAQAPIDNQLSPFLISKTNTVTSSHSNPCFQINTNNNNKHLHNLNQSMLTQTHNLKQYNSKTQSQAIQDSNRTFKKYKINASETPNRSSNTKH